MTNPSHRPKVLPESVPVQTTVPVATGAAIDLLVDLTATAKAAVVRQLMLAGLQSYQLANPELDAALPATTYKKEN